MTEHELDQEAALTVMTEIYAGTPLGKALIRHRIACAEQAERYAKLQAVSRIALGALRLLNERTESRQLALVISTLEVALEEC